jgi:hypothetical protein
MELLDPSAPKHAAIIANTVIVTEVGHDVIEGNVRSFFCFW